MKTFEEALSEVSALVVEQGRILDRLTPEEVAERAWRPGGPSKVEIVERFRRQRYRGPLSKRAPRELRSRGAQSEHNNRKGSDMNTVPAARSRAAIEDALLEGLPLSQPVGTVLRTLREKTGLTARQVAERAQVSESYLSRVESGKVTPTDAWLGYVAGVLSDALVGKSVRPDLCDQVAAVADDASVTL